MLVNYLKLMNRYYLDGVLVVEGKTDVSYLSSFISTLYFTTNGYDVSEDKISFLSEVAKVNRIIIFTDNDKAGFEIENKLKNKINDVFVVKSPKIFRKSYKKSGVAETEKSVIIETLKNYLVEDNNDRLKVNYDLATIISLSRNPNEIKKKIINDYRLISGNNKFLQEQLQMLKVKPEEIKRKYGN